ncbi:ribose ABC transporter permease [Rubrobacter xylanophilus]|uniref:Autoinducer 2 import system permease protein LsrD n=1 Tax=Rubrobacter xylanophilus TaxID=49319 RepID=A0A510HKN9_9ACTN|nr:ABC transporter permease [Rubrobacter xylanophilus]BBL79163.1 ribose ABC transporter permease [Rubrobacter xylanophilus]
MSATRQVLRGRLSGIRFSRELVLLGVLLAELAIMSQLSPVFLTVGNLLNLSRFFVEVGLIALGMTLIIITGGIDLSVGSNLALVSVVVGFSYVWGLPLGAAIVLGLLVGLLAGLFNGLFSTLLGLHPLVVTLGTFALFRGLAYGLSDADAVSNFPAWFAYFGQAYLGPVPGQLLVFVAAVVVVWLFLSRTAFGRYVYAIGNNEEAARFSGVPVERVKVALYAGTGFLVALAAIIYTSRVSTARGDSGLGLELDVISAVVLGGASIYGGTGTVAGTVLGVLIIATLRNGLLLAGVPSTWQLFLLGVLLLAAVFVNEFFRREES